MYHKRKWNIEQGNSHELKFSCHHMSTLGMVQQQPESKSIPHKKDEDKDCLWLGIGLELEVNANIKQSH